MFLAALLATPPAAAPTTAWDAKTNGSPKTYHIQGLTLTLESGKDADGDVVPTLTIATPGSAPTEFDGEAGFDHATASFGIGHFDPKVPGPQIEFASFTGGAHCCASISVIEPLGKSWKEVPLGEWDGDVPDKMPTDVDGDGTADFVFYDNDFLYAFDSYAASFAPPQIFNVIADKAIDVSTAPRYRKLYEADMASTKPECAKHQNGACAAFAADAARLGRFDDAWKFAIANYDKQSDWDYPTHCAGSMQHGKCMGKVVKPKGYPQALRWFLEDNHYISKQPGD
jgi:hypothetical protein